MKFFAVLVAFSFGFSPVVYAQYQGVSGAPVTITVSTDSSVGNSLTIPNDYNGLSFGTISLRPNPSHVFDSTNTQMLTLFRELGVRSLRIGGTSVDTNSAGYVPSHSDIDALFGFAKKAGVKVIYSLKLLNGDSVTDASTAKYIWDRFSNYLDCFAIGNEPDIYGKVGRHMSYSYYLAKWRRFADVVLDSVPHAQFTGPDGSDKSSWTGKFAADEKDSAMIKEISAHFYVGGSSKGLTSLQIAGEVLSSSWDTNNYPAESQISGAVAQAAGFPYRFTESNSFYTGGGSGVWGGNNCFATGLFSLDFMYWWAMHGCKGVGFHTSMWKYNGTFYRDFYGDYQIYPIGYGIKAFDLGGHGELRPVTISSNPDGLNMTTYATSDTDGDLFVTIINKEHGIGENGARVTINAGGVSDTMAVMYLRSPGNNPTAITGVTLGGAPINDNGQFHGKWTVLDTAAAGSYVVNVPPVTAVIVQFPTKLKGPFPMSPRLIAPDGAAHVPRRSTFTWEKVAGMESYHLQIATDTAFTAVVLDTVLPDTSVELADPLSDSTKYYWRVGSSDSTLFGPYSRPDSFTTGTGVDAVVGTKSLPDQFVVVQNFSNPFNPTTTIRFEIPKTSSVTLKIFDVLGRELKSWDYGVLQRGKYEKSVNMDQYSSGVYFYRVVAAPLGGGRALSECRKMLELK